MKYELHDGWGFELYARVPAWGPHARNTYVFESAPVRGIRRKQTGEFTYWLFEMYSEYEYRWVPLESPDKPKPLGKYKEVREHPELQRVRYLERYR